MEYQINWGSVADWAAAAASFLASVTALYLAGAADRVKLRGVWGIRLVLGDGGPAGKSPPELLYVRVTNTGRRSAKITHTAIRWGFIKRHHGLIIRWGSEYSNPLPVVLHDGEEAGWGVELRARQDDWIRDQLFKEATPSWLDVHATRFIIHTSAGARLVIKPERALLNRLHQRRKEMLQAPSTASA